ncbi:response regulator receiver domain [Ancylobacter sp. SL191]|uniref:response regulator receiver domain n=1 Tax=Ancylobacter sp. SL191 TaxID=2995166 RepID=UPI00226D75D5|nr:response regulator receiver domain [Ancylobacter sp. SL191]WAC28786.1 response regulator receiver domain [Ancylobacter sp. SL191]
MADGAYAAAVKETFETKPLRTVLMIDDEFPSLADMIKGEDGTSKFKQKDRALTLYEGFRARHMICDIENEIDDVKTELFRKSDLIILDYNLGPAEGDNERAISVLRQLASSKHFNTVVVYTADPKQDEVWLSVLSSLAGDWTGLPGALTGEAQEHWDRLSDAQKLPEPMQEAVMAFAARQEFKDIPKAVREAAQKELTDLEVPRIATADIIKAMIHREMARHAGKWAGEPRRRAVGGSVDGVRWVQSHNSFIAILQKRDDLAEDPTDPYGIMACLGKALLAWRPNLIQIIISEIQNVLELEALATEDEHLSEPETQTALWYYLLQALGTLDLDKSPDVRVPLMSIVDKIVDGIRRRLSTDSKIIDLASHALLGELRSIGWTTQSWPQVGKAEMVRGAATLARTTGKINQSDVLFRLNSFLSTERFRRSHITTGTIFRNNDGSGYWVAASPACDLVARKPGEQQAWAHEIHPLTAVVALRLLPFESVSSALNEASRANHVFLELEGQQKVFKLVNGMGQPVYEFLFATDEGRITSEEGRTFFRASRLVGQHGGSRELVEERFEVVDQLRSLNATRVLHSTGQHLSRIGLDFVDMPAN